MAGVVDPHRVFGAVHRAAAVEVRNDLFDVRERFTQAPAGHGRTGQPGERLGHHHRAADLAKDRKRCSVGRHGVVGPSGRSQRMALDAKQGGLEVAVVEFARAGDSQFGHRDRVGQVAAQELNLRNVAHQVGLDVALADLAAYLAPGPQELE